MRTFVYNQLSQTYGPEAEILRKKCQDAERAIDKAKAQRIWCKSQILFSARPRYPFSTCPPCLRCGYAGPSSLSNLEPDRRFHLWNEKCWLSTEGRGRG